MVAFGRFFCTFWLPGALFRLNCPSLGDFFLCFIWSLVSDVVFFAFWRPKGAKVDVLGGPGVVKPPIPLQRGIEILKSRFSLLKSKMSLSGIAF